MADEKKDKPGKGEKKVDVEASADVTGEEGKTHEVDLKAEATVRDVREQDLLAKAEAGSEECVYCGPIVGNVHWNVNCPVAQQQASKSADRPTAKATAPAPRAVSMAGRPD